MGILFTQERHFYFFLVTGTVVKRWGRSSACGASILGDNQHLSKPLWLLEEGVGSDALQPQPPSSRVVLPPAPKGTIQALRSPLGIPMDTPAQLNHHEMWRHQP